MAIGKISRLTTAAMKVITRATRLSRSRPMLTKKTFALSAQLSVSGEVVPRSAPGDTHQCQSSARCLRNYDSIRPIMTASSPDSRAFDFYAELAEDVVRGCRMEADLRHFVVIQIALRLHRARLAAHRNGDVRIVFADELVGP